MSGTRLSSFQKNHLYKLTGFLGSDDILIERLHELGFRIGSEFLYKGRGPFQGPHLIEFQSVTLALRDSELQSLSVVGKEYGIR